MPTVTRWYIKAALAYLVAALLIGVALTTPGVSSVPPAIAAWGPVYFHFFMLGWVAQLIFGVVYWMFPRYTREQPRGSETMALATFVLLNSGLVLRGLGEPINALSPGAFWGWVVACSAVLQWLAGMLFVLNSWARVKER